MFNKRNIKQFGLRVCLQGQVAQWLDRWTMKNGELTRDEEDGTTYQYDLGPLTIVSHWYEYGQMCGVQTYWNGRKIGKMLMY